MWNLLGLGVCGFVVYEMYTTDIVSIFTETVINNEKMRGYTNGMSDIMKEIPKITKEIPYYCGVMYDYTIFKSRGYFSDLFDSGRIESSKDKYTITYYHGTNKYKSVFPKRRGLLGISKVFSGEKDITKEFGELLGPGHNFHGTNPTPKFLGYDCGLKIEFMNGGILSYEPDEQILF